MEENQPMGPFCQSCSMPLDKDELFGTNVDGSKNEEYCTYCYQKGEFTSPNMSMEDMIKLVDEKMKEQNLPEDLIEKSKQYIPILKRWNKQ